MNKYLKEILLKCRIISGRRYYKHIQFARYVWDFYHPNDIFQIGMGLVIHHKDGDPFNDDISNLEKMTRGEHQICHRKNKHQSKETIDKRTAKLKNRKRTKEQCKTLSISHMGKHYSPETKFKKGRIPWNKGITLKKK